MRLASNRVSTLESAGSWVRALKFGICCPATRPTMSDDGRLQPFLRLIAQRCTERAPGLLGGSWIHAVRNLVKPCVLRRTLCWRSDVTNLLQDQQHSPLTRNGAHSEHRTRKDGDVLSP